MFLVRPNVEAQRTDAAGGRSAAATSYGAHAARTMEPALPHRANHNGTGAQRRCQNRGWRMPLSIALALRPCALPEFETRHAATKSKGRDLGEPTVTEHR